MALAKKNVIQLKALNRSQLIAQIKSAYLNAPLAQFPKIKSIIRDLGLSAADVSFDEVETIFRQENWQALRDAYLEQQHQFSRRELELTIEVRNIELMGILDTRIKITQRLDMQFLTKGKATTLDGTSELIEYTYDPRSITALILALNDLYRANSEAKRFVENVSDKSAPIATPHMLAHLQKVAKMSPTELMEETRKLDKMIQLLAGPDKDNEEEIRRQHPRLQNR